MLVDQFDKVIIPSW